MIEDTQSTGSIRRAVPDDVIAIASVLQRAFAKYQPAYTPAAFAATTPRPDQVRARFDEGPVWVALLKATVVGTLSAVPQGEVLYLRSMAVAPEARGKGLGQQLLETAERFALERGCRRLRLSTTPFLTEAIRLYERYGFSRSDQGPDELFGTPLFTMIKVLRA